jgi:anti-sigma regulatory factor (Ser/Thr protein kinase)
VKVNAQNAALLSVPPSGTAKELYGLIRALSPAPEIMVFASGLTFLKPLEMCLLRALLQQAAALAEEVLFEPPFSSQLDRYLVRMDFYKGLPSNISFTRTLPRTGRRDRSDALIEIKAIGEAADVEAVMDRVRKVTRRVLTGDVASACTVALTEACANALEHSQSPIGGLVSAQRYPSSAGLELAVIDLGIGIQRSLEANPSYRDLGVVEAIALALEPGVSSLAAGTDRGLGLPSLVNAAADVGQASLRIRSGAGELTLSWIAGLGAQKKTLHHVDALGTSIWLRLEPGKEEEQ